ncbi:Gfo/Idh/MocA family protein [Hoeflea prorocentri]|uniref:Gfo/Idh/MocA family oxidoreductase n=1 Tax=Hoeflea prorocentri TaxID=1922333 RepID=A0A9X3UGY3_9HYPH|nr:Gfo/Idh/MocA family oxidoreductase [Hoeflea prorocentri]MCY6381183.1 Gfo/Idh/MocA family oxidoreductase [Hoeflea prorocentri]MDA5398983.1 Gfo/Idh/MocA family oxidoreductase [Hoeflea prorocentri]
MAEQLGVGIMGCGNISAAYMKLAPLFSGFEIRACADISQEAASARAEEFGLRAETVDGLLAADDIDIIVNLTIPAAHYEVSRSILEAGKHVYSEKPFVLSVAEGRDLSELAASKGLRIGSAPDTFLGGSHQLARHLIDAGTVGKITGGTCYVLSHGMEHWHPNPDFFFKPGGGPILDIAPYYITNLVQLIGPVKRVAALSSTPSPERTITSQPRHGEKITVETPTTFHAILEFRNGATVSLGASWDVWQHGHSPMELYGEDGSLFVPDPNFFSGELKVTSKAEFTDERPAWNHPFNKINEGSEDNGVANYRASGLADMAHAIAVNRPHRCSLEMALHVVEVMTAILKSGENGTFQIMETDCERPKALPPDEAAALMA